MPPGTISLTNIVHIMHTYYIRLSLLVTDCYCSLSTIQFKNHGTKTDSCIIFIGSISNMLNTVIGRYYLF